MKKIFIIIALFVITLSSNLFAREPNFKVKKTNGQMVTVGDASYIGYNTVSWEPKGMWFWSYIDVRCSNPGSEQCRVSVGGMSYFFTITDINNSEITFDFDARVIEQISNEMLDEIDQLNLNGKMSGNLSRDVSLYDLKGIQHYVNFSAVYQLNENGDGEIDLFINTFEK